VIELPMVRSRMLYRAGQASTVRCASVTIASRPTCASCRRFAAGLHRPEGGACGIARRRSGQRWTFGGTGVAGHVLCCTLLGVTLAAALQATIVWATERRTRC
jgi:hypothetical protein